MAVVPSTSTLPSISGLTAVNLDNLVAGSADGYPAVPAVVTGVKIDNSSNSTEAVYIRFYDDLTPVAGTEKAHMVLKCPVSGTVEYQFGGEDDSSPRGIDFTVGVSALACKEAGADAGSLTDPTVAVDVSYTYLVT